MWEADGSTSASSLGDKKRGGRIQFLSGYFPRGPIRVVLSTPFRLVAPGDTRLHRGRGTDGEAVIDA